MSTSKEIYNVGGKIKKLARIIWRLSNFLAILGCAGGLITFIVGLIEEESLVITIGFTILGGSLIAFLTNYIGYWFTYAFGQLVENSDIIAGRLSLIQSESVPKELETPYYSKEAPVPQNNKSIKKIDKAKLDMLDSLLKDEIITKAEYDKKLQDLMEEI
ncbi:MAG: hypothetical protein IKU10_05595 [Clostridia bacterium]|nr:hypothetical protein [Clostridia bacterium]